MILVIPDIHGREFWRYAINNIDKYDKIIFLGDYLDPYPFENIYVEDAIDNFKEIIRFKENNENKVILLLGNHDIYYFYGLQGPSRWSWVHHHEIEDLFSDNKSLFQLSYETDKTLFTHAGVTKGWLSSCSIIENISSLNKLLIDDNEDFITEPKEFRLLLSVSYLRGGNNKYGSCLWCDVNEHLNESDHIDKYQIFGHTLQLDLTKYYKTYNESDIMDGEPIFNDNFAMLDCRHIFEYDEINKKFNKL